MVFSTKAPTTIIFIFLCLAPLHNIVSPFFTRTGSLRDVHTSVPPPGNSPYSPSPAEHTIAWRHM